MDSLTSNGKRTDTKGLQGTMGTSNCADYGVCLFLNVCASYLKAQGKKNEGIITTEEQSFQYDEPFGPYTEYKGTEGFPRFDFDDPNILSQSNCYDCGLAVVANSMAFVKAAKKIEFTKAMKLSTNSRLDLDKNLDVHFCFKTRNYSYSVNRFWTKLMEDGYTR